VNSFKDYKVYAIIVTYNGERWVDSCLGSLTESVYPVKVVVIDNCSTDNTVRTIQEKFPHVKVIQNNVNSGFGDANNIGIRIAVEERADFVFLLNQDAWIQRDTIKKLVDASVKFPEYGVISTLHFDGSGKNLDHAFANYLRQSDYSLDTIEEEKSTQILPIDFVNAAAWFLNRKCIETVGGFGPLFVQYGEDRDYIQRLKFHGFETGFIASTRIFHDRQGRSFDFSVNSKFVWYYYTGCVVRVADINYSLFIATLKVTLWCLGDCLKFFFTGRWYSPIAFAKVFVQMAGKLPEIIGYRKKLRSKQKFLFLEKVHR
jgi:GT2 family glycosyltransferase